MSLLKRITRVVKSNLNEMISRVENPEKILNQVILDMQKQMQEAKQQVALAAADEKHLKKKLSEELSSSESWEQKAMRAVQLGDDELAKQALARKAKHTEMLSEYQHQWELQHDAVTKLKEALRLLQQKIEEAERQKHLLLARQKRAEAQKMIHSTMSGINAHDTGSTIGRMAQKVQALEAEAEAYAELEISDEERTLEQRFQALEAEQEQEDALAALKARMGLTPEAAPQKEVVRETEKVREKVPVPQEEDGW